MSVALALAAISQGFSFSYVGGKERTKNGVGIVVDGHEEIHDNVNPWDFLAIEERKNIAVLFDQYQFRAAKRLTEVLEEKSGKHEAVFRKMGLLIEGYSMWDLFRHQEAVRLFEKARPDTILDGEDRTMIRLASAAKQHSDFLAKNIVQKNKHPSLFHIVDLFLNAERRAEEGKIDDAILRLYRVVEMIAQERLYSGYGIDTSNVKESEIPENLSADFIKKYKSVQNGVIKIPQAASFILLSALEDNLGNLFETRREQFKDIQAARNDSYLAHGFGSSKEATYEKLKAFVLSLNVFDINDAPTFPKLGS